MGTGPDMDLGEAMAASREIEKIVDGAFRDMDEMQEKRAWEAMGYGSWEECFDEEFRESMEDLLVVLDTGRAGPPRRLEEFRMAMERHFTSLS